MVDPNEITVFAKTNFRNLQREFGIKRDDRRRHMYVIGKTGMGKSTLLENMIIDDIRKNRGVAVVDPHGDLADKIISYIPSERTNDVIYFNPADQKFPIAFNILESIGPDYKHLVAYGLVGVFKKIWADSWGPRMEYILTNTILALLDYPGSTLLGVMRMLVDKAYRKKVVAKVTDPVVKTFWSDEFSNYSEKFRTEAIAPIQNKVGQFLASSIIRNIVGQSKSTIEMRDIMDNEKILIMNLSKGRVGEENSALLGAMMITKLQIAAMSRVDVPEEERKDFYLYVDEFQNFATDSFAGILSEARKYRLNLIMAHQYIEQLGDEVRNAVFGNVGTMLVFRVGAADALVLEPEFAPQFTAQDIVNLDKYTFILRLMIDGIATEPFSAIGMAPFAAEETSERDKIIRVSRERYGRPQDIVEDRIIRWSGVEMKIDKKPEAQSDPDINPDDNDFMDDEDKEDNVAEVSDAETLSEDADQTAGPIDSSIDSQASESMSEPYISDQPDLADRMIPSEDHVLPDHAPRDFTSLPNVSPNVSPSTAVETESPAVQIQVNETIDEDIFHGPTAMIPEVTVQNGRDIDSKPDIDASDIASQDITSQDIASPSDTVRVPKINIISSLQKKPTKDTSPVSSVDSGSLPESPLPAESALPSESASQADGQLVDGPESDDTSSSENISDGISDGISLRDLRTGQVETVAFTGGQLETKPVQSASELEPQSQSISESTSEPASELTSQPKPQSQTNDQANDQVNDQPKKKRKRKRKKKNNPPEPTQASTSGPSASSANRVSNTGTPNSIQSNSGTPNNVTPNSTTPNSGAQHERNSAPQTTQNSTQDDPDDKTRVSLDDL